MNKKAWLAIAVLIMVGGGAYYVSGRSVLGSFIPSRDRAPQSSSSRNPTDAPKSMSYTPEITTLDVQPKPQAFTVEIAPKNDFITRSQLAYLLMKTVQNYGSGGVSSCGKDIDFKKPSSVTGYSFEYICAAVGKGIMPLDSNGNFNPYAYVNRAQAASYFHNAFDPLGGVDFKVSNPPYKDTPIVNYPYVVWLAYYKVGDIIQSPLNNFFPSTNLTIGRAFYWIENAKKNVPSSKWAQ